MNCQVLASKAKIYMVLEYVNGGELFERIVSRFLFCREMQLIVIYGALCTVTVKVCIFWKKQFLIFSHAYIIYRHQEENIPKLKAGSYFNN